MKFLKSNVIPSFVDVAPTRNSSQSWTVTDLVAASKWLVHPYNLEADCGITRCMKICICHNGITFSEILVKLKVKIIDLSEVLCVSDLVKYFVRVF
jgi:hypothetical protein